jgi:hypothetical protein
MKICLRDLLPALALASSCLVGLTGCHSDEPILSQPPPEVDAAPDPVPPPRDTAAPLPDAAMVNLGDGATAGDGGAADGRDPSADLGLGVAPDATADARTCGAQGQSPCPGSQCGEGLCLGELGKCIGPGMACGQGSGNCNANGSCGPSNQTCGGANQDCCGIGSPPEGAFCSASGTTCLGNGANRMCRACGGPGQPCCGAGETCRQGACMGNGMNRTCP